MTSAIMYADKMTKSMQATLDETSYRREKQMRYNEINGLKPMPLNKKISENLVGRSKDFPDTRYTQKEIIQKVAEVKESYDQEGLAELKNKKKWKMLQKISIS
jgi:excinuclease ABC subunit B